MSREKQQQAQERAVEAARYRHANDAAQPPIPADDYARAAGKSFGTEAEQQGTEPRRLRESDEVWKVANSAIDAAVARGDFDNLAYAGKPIPGLGGTNDPDWWIKGLMQREQVSGLGPPALMLRKEDAELAATMDAMGSETRVRELLADFNSRIIEARRQLLGGPPVVTRLRDIDAEVAAWRARAGARQAAHEKAGHAEAAPEDKAAQASAHAERRGFLARLLRGR